MTYPAIDADDLAPAEPREKAQARGPFVAFTWQAVLSFFLQRIGVNQVIGGVMYPLPVSLIGTPVVLGWLIWQGWARPSPTRIVLYCAVVIGGCMSLLLAKGEVSALSMYMYVALYALFLFPVVLEDDAYERYYRFVLKVCVILCIIGVVQYLLQYVWQADWLFSWRDYIAPEFLIEYNTRNWTQWGSGIYKANGFFLMEASWLSQTAARAMLIAVVMLKDPRYLILCVPAMLVTYSGTGILLFALFGGIPLLLLFLNDRRILPWAMVGAVALPIGLMAFYEQLNLELFLRRLEEFSNPTSSGYFRFVVVQQMFQKFLSEAPLTLLFGSGPGTTDRYLAGYITDGFAPGWLKLFADYGFWGFTTFVTFLGVCVYQTTRSYIIAGAIIFQYLWLDGSLVVPQAAFVTLFLACLVVRKSTFRPFGTPAT